MHQRVPRSFQVGDARAISCDDGAADAVLFFGQTRLFDRLGRPAQSNSRARRVLRAGGVLMAVAISRFASAIYCIARGFIRDPDLFES